MSETKLTPAEMLGLSEQLYKEATERTMNLEDHISDEEREIEEITAEAREWARRARSSE